MAYNDFQSISRTSLVPEVCVRNAFKHYGFKKDSIKVLTGLNMTVPKNTIYGLLGASGCGKTTLLNSIVGLTKLNVGEIRVFGVRLTSKTTGIIENRIGYMPQEIALFQQFTIRETMKYFGMLTGITSEKVETNLEFLVKFLMLPDANHYVENLSGGQKRKVSLAVALLHQPELLILDEPTVGVDPILRDEIWKHLVQITEDGHTTIIITTHYIEEARHAHTVGLMRGGCLLAEESPEALIARYGAETLEDVFIKLCVVQNQSSSNQMQTEKPDTPCKENIDPISHPFIESIEGRHTNYNRKINHLKALVWKNFLTIFRDIPYMIFVVGLPICTIVLFYISFGNHPKNLQISVVNYELEENEACNTSLSCESDRLSCAYLDSLAKYDMILTYYAEKADAVESVRLGYSWATLVFRHNYSDVLRSRYNNEDKYIDYADIDVYIDLSDAVVGAYIKRYLYYSFQEILQNYLSSCNISRKFGTIPMLFKQPVYGQQMPNFNDFGAPGLIMCMIFTFAVALTTVVMLTEKKEGLFERSLVNGVSQLQILTGFLISQTVLMVIQAGSILIISIAVFHITIVGDVTLAAVFTLAAGFCGMTFGALISTVCDSESIAAYIAVGSFLPITLTSGVIWPTEGMHDILKPISVVLPLTKALDALRFVFQRGWGMSADAVYGGLIVIVSWIALLLIVNVAVIKYSNN